MSSHAYAHIYILQIWKIRIKSNTKFTFATQIFVAIENIFYLNKTSAIINYLSFKLQIKKVMDCKRRVYTIKLFLKTKEQC